MQGMNSKVQHVCVHHALSQKDPPRFCSVSLVCNNHSDEMVSSAALLKLWTVVALNPNVSYSQMEICIYWRMLGECSLTKKRARGAKRKHVCYLCSLSAIISFLYKSSGDLQSKTHRSSLSLLKNFQIKDSKFG